MGWGFLWANPAVFLHKCFFGRVIGVLQDNLSSIFTQEFFGRQIEVLQYNLRRILIQVFLVGK